MTLDIFEPAKRQTRNRGLFWIGAAVAVYFMVRKG